MKRILAGLISGTMFTLMIFGAVSASEHENEGYEHGYRGYYGDDDRYEYGYGRPAVSSYPYSTYGNYEYRVAGRPYYDDKSYYGAGRYYEGLERYEGYGYDDDRYERRGYHH